MRDRAWAYRGWARHSGFLLSFSFPFRAFRSAPGGKVRSLGAPRGPSRAGGLGRVAGAGVRAGGAKTGSRSRSLGGPPRGGRGFGAAGFSPAGNASFALVGQKSKPQNGEQKKDFPSPKRRRFVKTGFFARYKEARRSGWPRGRKSPPGQRQPPLSAFALRREEARAAQSAFPLRRAKLPAARPALGRPPQGGPQSLEAPGWRPPRPLA